MAVAGAQLEGKASATTKISSVSLGNDGSMRILSSLRLAEFDLKTGYYLESSGTPVHKLDTPLALDRCDGCVDVLGHHIPAVEHAAGHVLACKEK